MRAGEAARNDPTVVGRYAIYDRIGAGGMATVHLGRLAGGAGFSRTVAIKRLHAQYALDPDFVNMFVDEGRVASRVQHPNVVTTFDVVHEGGELFLVMEYVEGEALGALVRAANKKRERTPPALAVAIAIDALNGLHAAHTATNEIGEPLDLVHRDVSPHNVLVGTDGVARVLDFGIAKAMGRVQTTREGRLKGKLGYMSPEHVAGRDVSPRSDVFGVGIVLWELLTGKHLFEGEGEAALLNAVQQQKIRPPSDFVAGMPVDLENVVMKALQRKPEERFTSAAEMAEALEHAVIPANRRAVGEWVTHLMGDGLKARRELVAGIEAASTGQAPPFSVRRAIESSPSLGLPPPGEATTMVRKRTPKLTLGVAAAIAGLGCVAITLWLLLRSPAAEIAPAIAAPTLPPAATIPAAEAMPTPLPTLTAPEPASAEPAPTEPAKAAPRRPAPTNASTAQPPTVKARPPARPKDPPKGGIFSRE